MNDTDTAGLAAEMLAEATNEGVDVADAYQITTVIPYAEKPPEVKEYVMPPQDMGGFFHGYRETSEIVVDVRPASD